MNFSWKKKLLNICPFLLGVFFILLSQVPISLIPYYHQSFPFILGIIFYFSIFNPSLLNVFCVFGLGMISDLITSVPLGFNIFGYVFLYFISNLFHSYLIGMNFKQLWCIFCILLFCTNVIWAFLFFLISGIWVSTGFWFVQYLFVCLSYPFICRICGYLNFKIQELS